MHLTQLLLYTPHELMNQSSLLVSLIDGVPQFLPRDDSDELSVSRDVAVCDAHDTEEHVNL